MNKWIHNITGVEQTYCTRPVAAGAFFEIPAHLLTEYQEASEVLSALLAGEAKMSSDGVNDLTGSNAQHLSYLINTPATEVVTQAEKDDKELVLASIEGDFAGNECVLKIKIPGTPGNLSGRYIAGGYGFTDIYCWGDRVSKVEVIDIDFDLAGILYPATPAEAGIEGLPEGTQWVDIMPLGVALGSYTDDECPEACRGWRLWCDDGNQGGVDIDPLAGYGKLPSAAWMVLTFTKKPASTASHACVNLWWGKGKS